MAFAVTAGTSSSGSTTSPLSVSTPASVASGDLLLTVFESANAYTSITATGWTLVSAFQQTTPAQTNLTVMGRVSDGSEGASQSFTYTGTLNHWSGRMFRITGHGVSSIGSDITVGTAVGGTATPVSGITSITPPDNSLLMLFATSGRDAISTTEWSTWATANLSSGNWTEVADNYVNTGNGGGFGVAHSGNNYTTGAAGAGSATLATSLEWAAVLIGVKPPSAAVAPTFAMAGKALYPNLTAI